MRAGTQNGNGSFMSGECSLDYLIYDPYNASLSRSCEFYLHYMFTSNIVDLPAAHVMVLRSQGKKCYSITDLHSEWQSFELLNKLTVMVMLGGGMCMCIGWSNSLCDIAVRAKEQCRIRGSDSPV
jgi:hypothetical protein